MDADETPFTDNLVRTHYGGGPYEL